VVLTSDADYRELLAIKYERLKDEVARGFESFGKGQPQRPSVDEIAGEVLMRNSKH
jgi:hypothetical protein